jgi:hypothetical protein
MQQVVMATPPGGGGGKVTIYLNGVLRLTTLIILSVVYKRHYRHYRFLAITSNIWMEVNYKSKKTWKGTVVA